MAIFYGLLWVCIIGIRDKKVKNKSFIRRYYERERSHKFVFLDKIVRFTYFTVVWACVLQFTWFENEPQAFHIWNSTILIVLFILAVLYPILGFLYLYRKYSSILRQTFNPLYFDIRIRGGKIFFYFIFKYYKLLLIALLIGLAYKEPLASLIPLIVVNIVDGLILLFLKPYYLEYAE